MNAEKITAWACPQCRAPFADKDGARSCCPLGTVSGWQCGQCAGVWATRDEASRCCRGRV